MNRRSFLRAAPVAGAVIAAPALALAVSPAMPSQSMTLEEICDYHAEKLRDAMQALHGGQWQWGVSHDYGLAHINIIR